VRSRWGGTLAIAATLAAVGVYGCNELTGSVRPVPPVHRLPAEVVGKTILIAEDPEIETRDPVHIARAREERIPQDLRASMTTAFTLAGFKVVSSKAQPHDLVAKLALAVREEGSRVYQTYRCGLRAPDGTAVVQIDWLWPQGTYVAEGDVLDFATHNVVTEISMSPRVMGYLRAQRGDAADGGAPSATSDAGTTP
jgi:hypothetical protein